MPVTRNNMAQQTKRHPFKKNKSKERIESRLVVRIRYLQYSAATATTKSTIKRCIDADGKNLNFVMCVCIYLEHD